MVDYYILELETALEKMKALAADTGKDYFLVQGVIATFANNTAKLMGNYTHRVSMVSVRGERVAVVKPDEHVDYFRQLKDFQDCNSGAPSVSINGAYMTLTDYKQKNYQWYQFIIEEGIISPSPFYDEDENIDAHIIIPDKYRRKA